MEEIERASARGGAQIGESDKKVKIGKRCKVGKIDKIAKHRWEDMTGHGDSMQKEISGRKPKNMVLQYAHQGARAASIMLRWSMTSQSLRKERMNPEWIQNDGRAPEAPEAPTDSYLKWRFVLPSVEIYRLAQENLHCLFLVGDLCSQDNSAVEFCFLPSILPWVLFSIGKPQRKFPQIPNWK